MIEPVHYNGRRLIATHVPMLTVAPPEPWMTDALCRRPGSDPDCFYPTGGGRGTASARAAKKICADCPVAASCLEYALRVGDQWGVFGGTTPRERAALRRRGVA